MFSAFPFSGCFCEDFENKYAYLQVERGNPKVYAISKTITIMLVAELTMMFGVMLYVSLLHLRLLLFCILFTPKIILLTSNSIRLRHQIK